MSLSARQQWQLEQQNTDPLSGPKAIAVDWGTIRVGLAYSPDGECIFSAGICAPDQALAEIKRLIAQHDLTCVVVGLPLTANEQSTEWAEEVKSITEQWELPIPIHYVSEWRTTQAVKTDSKSNIDDLAARQILQRFWETH